MQISTPHTRFFRLFYCSPKQGDNKHYGLKPKRRYAN
nr:MAG TPA: hypothetical protein [Crassvirales sp.]